MRLQEKLKSKINFETFGVEIPPYNENASNTHKFTGHERDVSTGYDYMHFRYYASSMGRFLKPDNIIPNTFNPQSWNLYSYVNNNPVDFNDPSGHDLRGKQGKLGMHQALLGVPNVDISGMLTPVEIYEWFSGNILYGNVPTAGEYYRAQYASSHSGVSGSVNASHKAFTDWVSDIELKVPNLTPEVLSTLESIYQMSLNYSIELAFYISLANCGGLATVVVFGDQISVSASLFELSPNEISFFERTIGYSENNLLAFGHTHPQEGKKIVLSNGKVLFSGLGVSEADINYYADFWWNNFPSTSLIVLQMTRDFNLIEMTIDFYDCNAVGRRSIILGGN